MVRAQHLLLVVEDNQNDVELMLNDLLLRRGGS